VTPAKNGRSSAVLRRQNQIGPSSSVLPSPGFKRDFVTTRRQAGDFSQARVAADNRKSCDFSSPTKAIFHPHRQQQQQQQQQHLPPPLRFNSQQVSYRPGGDVIRQHQPVPVVGLGRRAVTQLDFGTNRHRGGNVNGSVISAEGSRFQFASRNNLGPYSSDSEFTSSSRQLQVQHQQQQQQRRGRPHVLLQQQRDMKRQAQLAQVRKKEGGKEGNQ
jgi:hypothetical protein